MSTQSPVHREIYTHTCRLLQTNTQTHIQIHTQTHNQIETKIYTHTETHANTHTHTPQSILTVFEMVKSFSLEDFSIAWLPAGFSLHDRNRTRPAWQNRARTTKPTIKHRENDSLRLFPRISKILYEVTEVVPAASSQGFTELTCP